MRKLSSINLVVRKLSLTFAAYSVMNERSNIRKNRELIKFSIMSETDETKKWQTQSVKHKVATVLILDGVPFSYNEESGIMFTAPEFYVEKLKDRLMYAYGCSQKPIINEIK